MFVAAVVLSGVGLVFGVALAVGAKKFKVTVDKRVEEIEEVLPKTNCGGCGFPGCSGFASAVASGKAPIGGCTAGGREVAEKIASLMGGTVGEIVEKVAVVHCKGGKDVAKERALYNGITDCNAASIISNGSKSCAYGCLGLGSCCYVCPYDAITITDEGVAVIDRERCTGCGACIKECPRALITLIPKERQIYLACSTKDRGAAVKKYCSVGCTGCTLCVKASTVPGALMMSGALPVLDYSKEENFIAPAYKCPSNCFIDTAEKSRPKANINKNCTNCGDCVPSCPVKGAILPPDSDGERYRVDKQRCIGCGLCLPTCKDSAITLWGAMGHRQ